MQRQIETLSVNIESCNDFELKVERQNPLSYSVTYPIDCQISTVVFVIPGFGGDTNSDYMKNLSRFIAENFSVAVVNVRYHCFYSRPDNGAEIGFDDMDIVVLQDLIEQFQVDMSQIKELTRDNVLNALNEAVKLKKDANQLEKNHRVIVPMTLIPPNNEYQNFGVMQAMDHLYALRDLQSRLSNIVEQPKTVCIGSSHGGYIAHLMAKLAPNLVDYVVENSTYIRPPLNYILGKEADLRQYEYATLWSEHIQLNCFTQKLWTMNKHSPYYFSSNRYRIRNLLDEEHIKIMAQNQENKTHYISYHSIKDELAKIDDKVSYCNILSENGFPVTLHTIENEEQIDGKFIKNLDHGMSMSIKELVKKELPAILDIPLVSLSKGESTVVYPCDTLKYRITINPDSVTAECE